MARDDDDFDPRDDDYDDDRRDDDDEAKPAFPGIVMAAGIIWIGFGCLEVFLALISMIVAAGQQAGQPAAGTTFNPICPGIIGFAFLVCGIQTVQGTASDTRGNGIGSLLLGLLLLLGGVAVVVGLAMGGNPQQGGRDPLEFVIMGGMLGIMALVLISAGVLALVGRSAYREWRKANRRSNRNNPPRPGRSSRYDDDEDA